LKGLQSYKKKTNRKETLKYVLA